MLVSSTWNSESPTVQSKVLDYHILLETSLTIIVPRPPKYTIIVYWALKGRVMEIIHAGLRRVGLGLLG